MLLNKTRRTDCDEVMCILCINWSNANLPKTEQRSGCVWSHVGWLWECCR